MRRPIIGLCLVLVAATSALALPRQERAEFHVYADRSAYRAGEEGRIAGVLAVDPGWHVNSHQPTYDYLIPTTMELRLPEGWSAGETVYPAPAVETFSFAEEPLSIFSGETVLTAPFHAPAAAEPGVYPITAETTYQACDDRSCLPPVTTTSTTEVEIGLEGEPTSINDEIFSAAPPPEDASGTGPDAPELALMLLLGLIGGLILNAMPCVLPVLSIKAFALVQSATLSRREVATSGLATAAGIVVSFLGLAAAALVARAAGHAVGWGVQFQNPAFVAVLAVVVVVFALNLWGFFEIQLPASLAEAMQGRGGQGGSGLAEHFASGLFATLMATPCSAPFLGTAVAFALAQPAGTVLAVFTAVGIGMALPYLALAVWPDAAKALPKPGPWMKTLKNLMGYLLAATAVWLFYVLAAQVSAAWLAYIELALLAVGFLVWLRSVLGRTTLRRLAVAGALACAIVTVWLAAAAPPAEAGLPGSRAETAELIEWRQFDRAEAKRLAASGTPVFVDVTADWCFTCKVNERLVLETEAVATAFREHGVVPMKADWTNRDDAISAYLDDHGRSGIPFYMLYRPGREPHLFGELITKDGIVRQLEEMKTAGG